MGKPQAVYRTILPGHEIMIVPVMEKQVLSQQLWRFSYEFATTTSAQLVAYPFCKGVKGLSQGWIKRSVNGIKLLVILRVLAWGHSFGFRNPVVAGAPRYRRHQHPPHPEEPLHKPLPLGIYEGTIRLKYAAQHLLPQIRTSPASRKDDVGGINAQSAHQRQGIVQPKADSLQDGSRHMLKAVPETQSDEGATSMRIRMRGTLARQIGQKEAALGTGRHLSRRFGKGIIGIGTAFAFKPSLLLAELVLKPLKGSRGGEHNSHQMPLTRNGMTESM